MTEDVLHVPVGCMAGFSPACLLLPADVLHVLMGRMGLVSACLLLPADALHVLMGRRGECLPDCFCLQTCCMC
jgi:hypothetical protein